MRRRCLTAPLLVIVAATACGGPVPSGPNAATPTPAPSEGTLFDDVEDLAAALAAPTFRKHSTETTPDRLSSITYSSETFSTTSTRAFYEEDAIPAAGMEIVRTEMFNGAVMISFVDQGGSALGGFLYMYGGGSETVVQVTIGARFAIAAAAIVALEPPNATLTENYSRDRTFARKSWTSTDAFDSLLSHYQAAIPAAGLELGSLTERIDHASLAFTDSGGTFSGSVGIFERRNGSRVSLFVGAN